MVTGRYTFEAKSAPRAFSSFPYSPQFAQRSYEPKHDIIRVEKQPRVTDTLQPMKTVQVKGIFMPSSCAPIS